MNFHKLRIQNKTVQKRPYGITSQYAHKKVRLWFKQGTKMNTDDPSKIIMTVLA